MRIGIILHGPEIVDEGSAERIIRIFLKEHDVTAILGGTMGRTAVLDAGLEELIDISQGMTPSQTINALKDSIDVAVLLNHGKTLETGMHFGRIVASKLDSLIPFVHIERPDIDGKIIYYDQRAKPFAKHFKSILMKHGNYHLPVEKSCPLPLQVENEGDMVVRRLAGVFPGENIRLDGIIIGNATSVQPEIVCRGGKVVELRGGIIKPHGLEKLNSRRINLFTAKVKTGSIRRTPHKRLIKRVSSNKSGIIAIIDHCAESTFELIRDASFVITVGDDTTAIAADILTRFGIPVIGITDGDLDSVLEDTEVPAGSVIIRVREGYDDILGKEVFKKIMNSKQQIQDKNIDNLLSRILALAEKDIVESIFIVKR